MTAYSAEDANAEIKDLIYSQRIIYQLTYLAVFNIIKVYMYSEPQHDKTNKMTCAPSLIRVVAVRMKTHWNLGYPLNSDQSGRMPRFI